MTKNEIERESIEQVIECFNHNNILGGEITQNQYEEYDLDFDNYKVEVKNRLFSIDDLIRYNNQGYLLELKKYNYLKDFNSLYVNYICLKERNLEIILTFDISKVENFDITQKECPTTTFFNNNNLIVKNTILLNIDNVKNIYIKRYDKYEKISPQKFQDLIEYIAYNEMKKQIHKKCSVQK